MKNLFELADAIKTEKIHPDNETILIYGHPSTGKTRLAATIAKVPWVERVFWFDVENGAQTLIKMVIDGALTEEEARKIIIFRIPDTPEAPYAYETTFKVLSSLNVLHKICATHGRANCPDCSKNKDAEYQGEIQLNKLTSKDFVVIDTISQVGDSIMNYLCKGKGMAFKPGWDEYGPQGRELNVILTTVQAARYCNFICLAQALPLEYEELDKKKDKIFPLCGTKNFSVKVAKYFVHKIYLEIDTKKHKAGSATTYKMDVITGSRSGWRIEDLSEARLDLLYAKLVEEKEKAKTISK